MLYAYVDESGDSGMVNSPSDSFTLGVVLIEASEWLECLDRLVELRRDLRRDVGLPSRAELKSAYLLRGNGSFSTLRLPMNDRLEVYRRVMQFQMSARWPTFAVCVDKKKIKVSSTDPRDKAWEFALQRLQRYAEGKGTQIHLMPDAGHGYFIRRKLREMRRHHNVKGHFGDQVLQRPAKQIVEDPSERHSHESYFIQLADLNAYAASRVVHPGRRLDGTMWEELGDSRIKEVNKLTGGPRGLVVWPL